MISLKLKANKASLITITRNNPVDLQKALRRMLDRLDNFLVADIEYTMDDAKTETPKYSAIILGSVPEGYINLTEIDTFDIDNSDLNPTEIPGEGDNPQGQGGQPDSPSEEGQTDNPNPPENPNEDKLNAIEQKQNETSESIEELKSQMAEVMELLRQLQQNNG